MPFKANDTNINTKGRAKGVKNKITLKTRNLLEALHSDNLNSIISEIDTLSIKDRLQLNRDILPFILPKYTTVHQENIDIESLVNDYILQHSIKLLTTAELSDLLGGEE